MKRLTIALCIVAAVAIAAPVTKYYYDIDMQSTHRIINLKYPANPGDAATKQYVDEQGGGGGGGGVSKDYVDTQDATTLASAKTYTDAKCLDTLDQANHGADERMKSALWAARAYADTNTRVYATTYTDLKCEQTLTSAKAYADTKDSETLTAAKAYTDRQVVEAKDFSDAIAFSYDGSYTPVATFPKQSGTVKFILIRPFTGSLTIPAVDGVTFSPSTFPLARHKAGEEFSVAVSCASPATNDFTMYVRSGDGHTLGALLVRPTPYEPKVYVSFNGTRWFAPGESGDISDFVPEMPPHTFNIYVRSDETYYDGVIGFNARDKQGQQSYVSTPSATTYSGEKEKTVSYTFTTGGPSLYYAENGLSLIVSVDGKKSPEGELYPSYQVGPFTASPDPE